MSAAGAPAPPRVAVLDPDPLEGVEAEVVARVVERAWSLFAGPPDARVEVAFVSEEEHCARHEAFLGDASPTDVMAFPYGDADLFGEILVNREMCLREAARRAVPVRGEALLYVAHGALHLLGFRDDTPAARRSMRAAERRTLAAL